MGFSESEEVNHASYLKSKEKNMIRFASTVIPVLAATTSLPPTAKANYSRSADSIFII
jgi:hypothetical protein